MGNALRDAGVAVEEVGYINAHGTSTLAGDLAESRAVETVFGDHARRLAMSSTKSMTEHLLGAASAVEAIFTVLALRNQAATPTNKQDNPEKDCNLDYAAHEAKVRQLEEAVSNSFDFGGTNGSLVFRRI